MKRSKTISLAVVLAFIMTSCEEDVPKPVASFSTTGENYGADITFKNLSTNATSYTWDFGDGTNSNETSPTHSYSSNDSFTVQLTAVGPGGSTTTTREVLVTNVLMGKWVELNNSKSGPCCIFIECGMASCRNSCETVTFGANTISNITDGEPTGDYVSYQVEGSIITITVFHQYSNEALFSPGDIISFTIVNGMLTITSQRTTLDGVCTRVRVFYKSRD